MSVDVWADSVQTVAVVVGAAALIFAWRQIKVARHGGTASNVLELWALLQSDQARAARGLVYHAHDRMGAFTVAADGSFNWTDDEVEAARHVAQVCSVTGALVKRDYVPLELLRDEWGPMMIRMWALVEPVMDRDRNYFGDPNHNKNFEVLASKC